MIADNPEFYELKMAKAADIVEQFVYNNRVVNCGKYNMNWLHFLIEFMGLVRETRVCAPPLCLLMNRRVQGISKSLKANLHKQPAGSDQLYIAAAIR